MNGHFSEKALQQFAEMAAESHYVSFSESETYDFTRCVRPNGTAYGTRGKCRKGTEQAARLEKEIPGIGGNFHVPGRAKSESPAEEKARIAEVAKRQSSAKARKESLRRFDESIAKMAGQHSKGTGRNVDDTKDDLMTAHSAGRGSKTSKLIESGNLSAVLQHAQEVTKGGIEAHIKSRVQEQRERQKAEDRQRVQALKESGATPEEMARSKSDAQFYNKRELKRTKVQAESEFNALRRLARP